MILQGFLNIFSSKIQQFKYFFQTIILPKCNHALWTISLSPQWKCEHITVMLGLGWRESSQHFFDWIFWLRQIYIKFDYYEFHFTIEQFLQLRKKLQPFPFFETLLTTFSRPGKVSWRFPYFLKNSSLCMNPAFMCQEQSVTICGCPIKFTCEKKVRILSEKGQQIFFGRCSKYNFYLFIYLNQYLFRASNLA